MTMRTFPILALLGLAFCDSAFAGTPDAALAKQLESLDYKYEVDKDGDFEMVFEAGEKGERSQIVYVRSPVETYGALRVREVMSPAYEASGDALPAAIANRLLESAQEQKLGGWVKQGRYAIFVVKIDAAASAEQLRDALEAAVEVADRMEAELTPGKDAL
ncbi:hypothetical protein [Lysobacter humi (ex Lee et al. 2017)]